MENKSPGKMSMDKKKSGIPIYVGRAGRNKKSPPRIILIDALKEKIKEAFNEFDVSGTGFINVKHLRYAIQRAGVEVTEGETENIVMAMSPFKIGRLSFNDFQYIMTHKYYEDAYENELLEAFCLFDDDETGKISFQNFKRMAQKTGQMFTDEELQELIDAVDLDHDGEINIEEFLHFMKAAEL